MEVKKWRGIFLFQGSKITLICSYFRVPQAAGQVKILIFLVKIIFSPYVPIIFVMQDKCLFKIFRGLYFQTCDGILFVWRPLHVPACIFYITGIIIQPVFCGYFREREHTDILKFSWIYLTYYLCKIRLSILSMSSKFLETELNGSLTTAWLLSERDNMKSLL